MAGHIDLHVITYISEERQLPDLYVPRLCSWCHLVASDRGSYTAGRYRTAPFACWYCPVHVLFCLLSSIEGLFLL